MKQDFTFEGFEPANTTPVPDVCWICQYHTYYAGQHKNSACAQSGLCARCFGDMLAKVGRQRRRARKRGLAVTLTTAQWVAKIHRSQGRCHYCNTFIGYRALTLEHLTPVAHGGGTTAENCVPACMICNHEKWEAVR